MDGTDVSSMNPTQSAIFRRRKVGLVYQFYNLIPTLTVKKNILMPLLLDKRKLNQEYFEQVVTSLGTSGQIGCPAEPVVRRAAAENGHCESAYLPSGHSSGRRANRQSGSEELQGNHGFAEIIQPESVSDHSADYP